MKKEAVKEKWIYHFDELTQETQRKIIDKYFSGETNLYASEKAREYRYTEDGRIINEKKS